MDARTERCEVMGCGRADSGEAGDRRLGPGQEGGVGDALPGISTTRSACGGPEGSGLCLQEVQPCLRSSRLRGGQGPCVYLAAVWGSPPHPVASG